MKCKICGFDLKQGEPFCQNCGASNTNEGVSDIIRDEKNVDEIIKPRVDDEKLETKKNNGSFFIALGTIITGIALIVIIYLVYNTLKTRDSIKTNADIAVITTNNYYLNYKNHTFTFNPEINVKVYDDYLELTSKNYKTKLFYESARSYEQVTLNIIKNAYFESSDYMLQEPSLKTKNNLSYYFADVDYINGNKSSFIIIPDKVTGYWLLEIGTPDFQNYPSGEIIDENLKIVLETKNTEEENKLNLEFSKIISNIPQTQIEE